MIKSSGKCDPKSKTEFSFFYLRKVRAETLKITFEEVRVQ